MTMEMLSLDREAAAARRRLRVEAIDLWITMTNHTSRRPCPCGPGLWCRSPYLSEAPES